MQARRQERFGWIGGWLGGFLWVLILSSVFLAQGKVVPAAIGFLIALAACLVVVRLSPWRYPQVRYRTLMLPIYTLFFAAVAWGVGSMEEPRQMGIHGWWSALLLLPILMPLWTTGARRWRDGDVP